jgi:integrase
MRKLTLRLTKRADGRVAKRIDGKYFTWASEDEAREFLLDLIKRRDKGLAPLTESIIPTDPPLRKIADAFRVQRKDRVKKKTWYDYDQAIVSFLSIVGRHRHVSDLRPADFTKVRERWAGRYGPWKLDVRVQAIRTMFRWAARTARLIEAEPWYGESFGKTTAADKRRVKREKVAQHGERVFSKPELQAILRAAKGPLHTFVLLGLNGGMYAADIAALRPSDLRREGRCDLIDTDREKTGVRRKLVLWPESVKGIAKHRARFGELLFVTVHDNPWVTDRANSIGMLFDRLLRAKKIHRAGVGFGALRHTHVSAVGDHPDLNAARLVRGHAVREIESHYDVPSIERIKAVTDLARRRLLSNVLQPASKRSATRGSRKRRGRSTSVSRAA